jgi:hypothetical protein
MANIRVSDAQAFLERTKANLGASLDVNLERFVAAQVLSQVAISYDTSGWTDETNTPLLVRNVIAMKYAAMHYQRLYSEDDGLSDYAIFLNANADALLEGIITGVNDLVEIEGDGPTTLVVEPAFYPNDRTTDQYGCVEGPKFTMGKIF